MAGKGKMELTPKTPNFFEADGALRAASNRNALLAFGAIIVAIVAIGVAIVARLQPPTVIRVGTNGEAEIVSPKGDLRSTVTPTELASIHAQELPTEIEKTAFVKRFLDSYLTYDEHSLAPNWATALNMTTSNLRASILSNMKAQNTVELYQNGHVRSVMTITSERHDEAAMTYTVYGQREVHSVADGKESAEDLTEAYTVRLVSTSRTERTPEGLLIAEFKAEQIHGVDQPPPTGSVPSGITN